MKESIEELKVSAVSGCWKKIWLEAVNDFQRFINQQGEIKNILVLVCKIPGGFPNFEGLLFRSSQVSCFCIN